MEPNSCDEIKYIDFLLKKYSNIKKTDYENIKNIPIIKIKKNR